MHEHQSREDYLERILILRDRLDHVRSIDIANDMLFSKPSVSIAMKKLKDANLINVDKNGYITLTKEGEDIAKNLYERHQVLTKSLLILGVDEKNANTDACEIEHDISEDTFKAIKEFVNKNS